MTRPLHPPPRPGPLAMTHAEIVWAKRVARRLVWSGTLGLDEARSLLRHLGREAISLWEFCRLIGLGHRAAAMDAATRLTGLSVHEVAELIEVRHQRYATPAQILLQAGLHAMRSRAKRRRMPVHNPHAHLTEPHLGRAAQPVSPVMIHWKPRHKSQA